jgi:hypothetical protein
MPSKMAPLGLFGKGTPDGDPQFAVTTSEGLSPTPKCWMPKYPDAT